MAVQSAQNTSSWPVGTESSRTLPQSRAAETQNQFLRLLVAQLKGQNPLDPMEGSEFVAQLAQFSSLEELTNISSSLENIQQLLAGQNLTKELLETKE